MSSVMMIITFLQTSASFLQLSINSHTPFFSENVSQAMGQVEILQNFVVEIYLNCCNTTAKSKIFYFAAMFQQYFLCRNQ